MLFDKQSVVKCENWVSNIMKQNNETPTTSFVFILWIIIVGIQTPGIFGFPKCQGLEFMNITTFQSLPELREPSSLSAQDPHEDLTSNQRVIFLKHGDLTMQVISWHYCNQMTRYGMTVAFTARYALEKLEKEFNRPFGLQIDTNCKHPLRTMSLAFETTSYYQQNSFCKKEYTPQCSERMMENDTLSKKRIFGVIGTHSSFDTRSLANILAAYNIPLVSWLASSEKLNQDKDGMSSFFRTIKPDTRVEIIYKMMKTFRWKYVGFIGSDDSYGRGALETLQAKFAYDSEYCFAYTKFIDDVKDTNLNDVKDIFRSLEEHPKLRIVIIFVKPKTRIELIARKSAYIWINFSFSTVKELNVENMILHMRNAEGQIVGFSHNKGTSDSALTEFISKSIREEYSCNEWIQNYVQGHYNGCNIKDLHGDIIYCNDTNQTISLTNLVKDFDSLEFHSNLLIDAVYALGSALHDACGMQSDCKPIDIVQKLHQISYRNANGELSSFDDKGNPSKFHSDFNLVKYNNETGQLEVQSFGHWNGSSDITINTKGTVWDKRDKDIFNHQCSKDCLPGNIRRYFKNCCWYCVRCKGSTNYTNTINQDKCNQCPMKHHTEDNIKCIPTRTIYVDLDDTAGKSVFYFSTICFIFGILVAGFFYKHRRLATMDDHSPHVYDMICITIIFNYVFAIFQIVEPTEGACVIRTSLFFLLIKAFSMFLLLMTQQVHKAIKEYAGMIFKGNILLTRIMFSLLIMLVQIGSLAYMFGAKDIRLCNQGLKSQVCIENSSKSNGFVIKKWCLVRLF